MAFFVTHCEPPFSVEPERGVLKPHATIEIKVICTPNCLRCHLEDDVFFVYDDIRLKVKVECEVVEANIYMHDNKLSFGEVFMNLQKQEIVKISNKSPYTVNFYWSMYKSNAIDALEKNRLSGAMEGMADMLKTKHNRLDFMNIIDGEGHNMVIEDQCKKAKQELEAKWRFAYKSEIFTIIPSEGVLHPNQTLDFLVVFSPKTNDYYSSWAYLDIGGKPQRLPLALSGVGKGPVVVFNATTLNINDVYMNARHEYQIVVKNDGHIPATVVFRGGKTEFGGDIECVPTTRHLSHFDKCKSFVIKFSSSAQGQFVEKVQFIIEESKEIIHFLLIKSLPIYIKPVIPVLECEPAEVSLNLCFLDFEYKRKIKLKNLTSYSGKLRYAPTKEPNTPFFVDITEVMIHPEHMAVIPVQCYLKNTGRHKSYVRCSITKGETIDVKIFAIGIEKIVKVFPQPEWVFYISAIFVVLKLMLLGVGCSILCEPEIVPEYDAGFLLTHQLFRLDVKFTNLGRKSTKLLWTRQKVLRSMKETEEIKSIFSMTPNQFELATNQCQVVEVEGMSTKVRTVEEDFHCFATFDKSNKPTLLMSAVIKASFIEPDIEFSKSQLEFMVSINEEGNLSLNSSLTGKQDVEQLMASKLISKDSENGESVAGVSGASTPTSILVEEQLTFVPSDTEEDDSYPKCSILHDGDLLQYMSLLIHDGEVYTATVKFVPEIYDKRYRKDEGSLTLQFDNHPKSVRLPLYGQLFYPSVVFMPKEIDFKCLPPLSMGSMTIIMKNTTRMPVRFAWSLKEEFFHLEELGVDLKDAKSKISSASLQTVASKPDVKVFKHNGTAISSKHGTKLLNQQETSEPTVKPSAHSTVSKADSIKEIQMLAAQESKSKSSGKKPRGSNTPGIDKKMHVMALDVIDACNILETLTECEWDDEKCDLEKARILRSMTEDKRSEIIDLEFAELLPEEPPESDPRSLRNILTIEPIEGVLSPYECMSIMVGLCLPPNVSVDVRAVCSIENGEDEQLVVKGFSSKISYVLDKKNIELGRQIGYLEPFEVPVHGFGVPAQIILSLSRPAIFELPVTMQYLAIAGLNIDYLRSQKEKSPNPPRHSSVHSICDTLGMNSSILQELDKEWVIITHNDIYPSEIEIELALEREILNQTLTSSMDAMQEHTIARKDHSIPNFMPPPYTLDFGYVILGKPVCYTVLIENYGPVETVVCIRSGKKAHSMSVEFKPRKLGVGEINQMCVICSPTVEEFGLEDGVIEKVCKLTVRHGGLIPISIKAKVTTPRVDLGYESIDFELVKVGCAFRNGYLDVNWSISLTSSSTTSSNPYSISPTEGYILPGKKQILTIIFMPKTKGVMKATVVVDIEGNRDAVRLKLVGEGVMPNLCISTTKLQFPPVLPFCSGSADMFTVKNMSEFPVEYCFPNYDEEYCEEEFLIQTHLLYNNLTTLLIPERLPGDKLPEIFNATLTKIKDAIKEKILQESGKETLKDPFVMCDKGQLVTMVNDYLNNLEDNIEYAETDGWLTARNEVAKLSIMEPARVEETANSRNTFFVIVHGGPTTEYHKVACRVSQKLGIPLYSIDYLILEELVNNASPAASEINAYIDKKIGIVEEKDNEDFPLPTEDEYDVLARKIAMAQAGKRIPKKEAPGDKKKGKKGSEKDSAKSSKSSKAGLENMFIKQYNDTFYCLLQAIGDANFVQLVLMNYVLGDHVARRDAELRKINEEKKKNLAETEAEQQSASHPHSKGQSSEKIVSGATSDAKSTSTKDKRSGKSSEKSSKSKKKEKSVNYTKKILKELPKTFKAQLQAYEDLMAELIHACEFWDKSRSMLTMPYVTDKKRSKGGSAKNSTKESKQSSKKPKQSSSEKLQPTLKSIGCSLWLFHNSAPKDTIEYPEVVAETLMKDVNLEKYRAEKERFSECPFKLPPDELFSVVERMNKFEKHIADAFSVRNYILVEGKGSGCSHSSQLSDRYDQHGRKYKKAKKRSFDRKSSALSGGSSKISVGTNIAYNVSCEANCVLPQLDFLPKKVFPTVMSSSAEKELSDRLVYTMDDNVFDFGYVLKGIRNKELRYEATLNMVNNSAMPCNVIVDIPEDSQFYCDPRSFTVPANDRDVVILYVQPSKKEVITSQLYVSTKNNPKVEIVNLRALSTPIDFSVTPKTLNFEKVPVGTTCKKKITLTNPSPIDLHYNLVSPKHFLEKFNVRKKEGMVQAYSSCHITITLTPMEEESYGKKQLELELYDKLLSETEPFEKVIVTVLAESQEYNIEFQNDIDLGEISGRKEHVIEFPMFNKGNFNVAVVFEICPATDMYFGNQQVSTTRTQTFDLTNNGRFPFDYSIISLKMLFDRLAKKSKSNLAGGKKGKEKKAKGSDSSKSSKKSKSDSNKSDKAKKSDKSAKKDKDSNKDKGSKGKGSKGSKKGKGKKKEKAKPVTKLQIPGYLIVPSTGTVAPNETAKIQVYCTPLEPIDYEDTIVINVSEPRKSDLNGRHLKLHAKGSEPRLDFDDIDRVFMEQYIVDSLGDFTQCVIDGKLEITYNAATNNKYVLKLIGESCIPRIVLLEPSPSKNQDQPSLILFPPTFVGEQSDHDVSIKNVGPIGAKVILEIGENTDEVLSLQVAEDTTKYLNISDYPPFVNVKYSTLVNLPPWKVGNFKVIYKPTREKKISALLRIHTVDNIFEIIRIELMGIGFSHEIRFDLPAAYYMGSSRANPTFSYDLDFGFTTLNRISNKSFTITNLSFNNSYKFNICSMDSVIFIPKQSTVEFEVLNGGIVPLQISWIITDYDQDNAQRPFSARAETSQRHGKSPTMFLLAGQCREPHVYFKTPFITIEPTVLRVPKSVMVEIRNDEYQECPFRFCKGSLLDEDCKRRLEVLPMSGSVPPRSESSLKITYNAEESGPVNFALRCIVKKIKEPLHLGISASCLAIVCKAFYRDVAGDHIALKPDEDNCMNFKNVMLKSPLVQKIHIVNEGTIGFYYTWQLDKNSASHFVDVSVEKEKGFVAGGTKTDSVLTLTPQRKTIVHNMKVILQISYGPRYVLNINAVAGQPLFRFSFIKYDFGYCVVQKDKTKYYTASLICKNHDNQSLVSKKGKGGKGKKNDKSKHNGSTEKSSKASKHESKKKFKDEDHGASGTEPVVPIGPKINLAEPPKIDMSEYVKISPKTSIHMLPDKKYELMIEFSAKQRLENFSEKIFYEVQDYTVPLCAVKGSYVAPEFSLDKNIITFANVVLGTSLDMYILLRNTGDLKGRFKWVIDNRLDEFTVHPMDGVITPKTVMKICITYKPKVIQRQLILKMKSVINGVIQLPLTVIANSVNLPEPTQHLNFVCPVRTDTCQYIAIYNPTKVTWNIKPVLHGEEFVVPDEITIPSETHYSLRICYCPRTMNKSGPHKAMMFLALPEGHCSLYDLTGVTQPPIIVDRITREIPCKKLYTETLKVQNWLNRQQTFTVKTQLLSTPTVKTIYKVTGKEVITVPPNSTKKYNWNIYVVNEESLDFKHNLELCYFPIKIEDTKCNFEAKSEQLGVFTYSLIVKANTPPFEKVVRFESELGEKSFCSGPYIIKAGGTSAVTFSNPFLETKPFHFDCDSEEFSIRNSEEEIRGRKSTKVMVNFIPQSLSNTSLSCPSTAKMTVRCLDPELQHISWLYYLQGDE
nr:unnamed protein product [Callosobruchus chinensis]